MRHFGRFLDKDSIQTENYHKMDNKFYNAAKDEQDKNNYKAAYKLYKKGVKSGDIRCNYGIAVFLTCGYLGEKDTDKANEIFAEVFSGIKVLAEQNDPISCCIIGFYYFNGYYVEEDKVEAVKWWKKSAEEKYAVAQYNLGVCYDNGYYVEENKVEAVKWYRKAAEQGYASAQYNLGICYDRGEGIEENRTEAAKWYRKAAEQGYVSAQYNLGICYDRGEGVEEDKAEAVKWYKKAAEQGIADAQYNLGYCYDNGERVEENKAKAVKWYRKAAEQGVSSAQCNLGNCYYNGEGVEENKAEAVKWYRKAAEQGVSSAQYNLGNCYYNGEGVEENKSEAVKWYRKAAEQGVPSAQYNLGICYDRGEGVEKDKEEAVKGYKKAAEQGHSSAQYNLGIVLIEEQEYEEAKNFFEQALLQGETAAHYGLALLYEQGNGVPQNGKKAISLYLEILKNVDCNWLFGLIYLNLAKIYDDNQPFCNGVYKDNFKAKEYYEKALEYGEDCKSDLKTLEALMNIDDSEANRMGEFVKEISRKNIPLASLYSVVENRLRQEFGEVWERLRKTSQECLITGCISYVSLISTGEENYKNMDFSSAVLPMVKACEIELGRIFFDRFLEYLQKNNISPKDFNPETQKFVVEDKLVKKPEEYNSDEKYFYYRVEKTTDGGIYTYVSPDKTGVFTLGGIDKYAGITKGQSFEPVIDRTNFIFGKNGVERIQSKQKYGRIKNVITVDKHILAFMDQVFTDAAFCGDDREEQIKKYLYSLSTRVRDMAFKLRNPASHTGVMPYWKALYCANMVIMVDRILYEFICKLKPEYTV